MNSTRQSPACTGYANFAIAGPPLKLVLLENPGQGGTLNHLGVESGAAGAGWVAAAADGGVGIAAAADGPALTAVACRCSGWLRMVSRWRARRSAGIA